MPLAAVAFLLLLGWTKCEMSPKGGQLPNTRRPKKEKRTRLNLTPGKRVFYFNPFYNNLKLKIIM